MGLLSAGDVAPAVITRQRDNGVSDYRQQSEPTWSIPLGAGRTVPILPGQNRCGLACVAPIRRLNRRPGASGETGKQAAATRTADPGRGTGAGVPGLTTGLEGRNQHRDRAAARKRRIYLSSAARSAAWCVAPETPELWRWPGPWPTVTLSEPHHSARAPPCRCVPALTHRALTWPTSRGAGCRSWRQQGAPGPWPGRDWCPVARGDGAARWAWLAVGPRLSGGDVERTGHGVAGPWARNVAGA